MSDIALINDSQQSAIVTNGIGKNGEIYMKAAGSTDAGALVVYDSGNWRKFAHEASSYSNDYSVDFDGTNDMITIPQGTFNLGTGNWTFSFWFRPTGITGTIETIFMVKGTSGKYLAGFVSNAAFMLSDWNNTTLSYSTPIANNTWYHGAYIKNGSGSTDLHLYLNGTKVLEGYHIYAPDYGNDTATTRIGEIQTIGSYSYPFQGQIDEFAFWNSALSASDITSIYNSGVPADISSLSPVGWWRMGDDDGGTGTTITDQGSGGNDGTLTNGPTFSSSVPS